MNMTMLMMMTMQMNMRTMHRKVDDECSYDDEECNGEYGDCKHMKLE
jgi:hypothetical protein